MRDTGFAKGALPAGVVVLCLAALLTGIGRASPTSFELLMKDGFHTPAEGDKFPLGFAHEGRFTASAPFCSSGYALDLALQPPIELRQFTCSDGSGSITARKVVVSANAQFTHEQGDWMIVEGTGRYATLRGKGTSVLDTISGDPADHISTRFNETWVGVIDFDVTPPKVSISQASGLLRTRRDGGERGLVRHDGERLRCLRSSDRHDDVGDRLESVPCAAG
jgi:hypothetical protein